MPFLPMNTNINITDIDVFIDNCKIPLEHFLLIFLGVVLDEKLSWKNHIFETACKISKVIER